MGKEFEKRKAEQASPEGPQFHEEEKRPSLPNSLVMRVMQQPDAEAEADRLSGGVTSSSPAMLRREMGERLGADFSQVHFHSDPGSIQRSMALGARAWTQGRDVYFGKGGFEPSVAAHELVHTVQQGAVRGNAGTSMPFGAVQLLPDEDEDDKKIKKGDAQESAQQDQGNDQGEAEPHAMTAIENSLVNTFASDNGSRVY